LSTRLFTSESVTEGHPDKIADQISDAVLDAVLLDDRAGRVACEVLVTTGLVLVAGEITAAVQPDIPMLARSTIHSIGYTDSAYGLDAETCAVLVALNRQSPDIAQGVDEGGAGDQGIMFGYATDEVTPEYMPLPVVLAHRLTEQLATVRKSGGLAWLRPDGKAQVTVEYDDGRPVRVHTIVLSAQHAPSVSLEEVRAGLIRDVIEPVMARTADQFTARGGDCPDAPDLSGVFGLERCTLHINPTGRFVIGGPHGDTGLTGRKIIVDTYGGAARHGGGAFSGKDPSKVDRSGAYAARWIAKNVVAACLARRCEVSIAYAIGVAEPVAVYVDTFGTGRVPDRTIAAAIESLVDLRPLALIERLGLRAPIYRPTSCYGHFGRAPYTAEVRGEMFDFFPWERTDLVDELRRRTGLS